MTRDPDADGYALAMIEVIRSLANHLDLRALDVRFEWRVASNQMEVLLMTRGYLIGSCYAARMVVTGETLHYSEWETVRSEAEKMARAWMAKIPGENLILLREA